jgi:DNA-binding transcriptional LysR family regulator
MKIFYEELVLITGRGVRPIRRAADLACMSMVAFATGCSYRKRLEDWLGASELLPARILELASYQTMIACVAAGTGFAVVPRSLLESLKSAHEVQQHELPVRVRRNHTHLVWNGTPSIALMRLQELLVELGAPRGGHAPKDRLALPLRSSSKTRAE